MIVLLTACAQTPALQQTERFFATRESWEQPLDAGIEVPDGIAGLSASACGTCHDAIYEEWKVSVHAAAWTDRQFQAEIQKSGNRWLCVQCHTPLLSQQAEWPVGLRDGDVEQPKLRPASHFDPALRDEGITCAACHVREGVIHGPGLGGDAPHPVKPDATFRSGALCEHCHEVSATIGDGYTCSFETGSEWRNGPAAQAGTGCVDCHMPTVERPAAAGGPVRSVRQHYWRGSGIPKVTGISTPIAANPPGLKVSALRGVDLHVTMRNTAGHALPTGDPERWVQVRTVFQDAEGRPIGAHEERFGQRWEWEPLPRRLDDTRLAAGATAIRRYAIPRGAASAVIEASSHRMTVETAAYHHLDDYPISLVTQRLELDLR